MKKITAIISIIALAFVGYFIWRVASISPTAAPGVVVAAPETAIPDAPAAISGYQYTETYAHPAGDFSFKYPSGFSAASMPAGDNGEAITVSDKDGKIGVQILVTPWSGQDIDITPDIVRSSVPGLRISDTRTVAVAGGHDGLAFLSDNPAFNGASSELWFVYKGNLYQLSAYQTSDAFLRGVFGTWKFTQK